MKSVSEGTLFTAKWYHAGGSPPASAQPRRSAIIRILVVQVVIPVQPRPYTAFIECGLVRAAGSRLADSFERKPERVFVVTAPPIRRHWGKVFAASLHEVDVEFHWLEVPDGERHKTVRTVEELAGRLVKRGADRGAILMAFGGGVVGDLTGFLASVYMRGVEVVHVPTTLLAQVDSSIGGKTGVNLPAGKNLLGTFYQPRAVFVDPGVLSTLPEREYRSGLYEALKYGIIRNRTIFEFMEEQRGRILRRDPEALQWLITECIRVKAEVVAADERESDLRRILNFGHTIGHALEAETAYKTYLHGEAVAWGMVAASMIGAELNPTTAETARRIISAVLAYAPLPRVAARGKRIARRLLADKKTQNGMVHFVLPVEIGRVQVVGDVPEHAVTQAVEELRYLSQA